MTLNLKQLQEKYPEVAKEFTELSFRLAEVDKTTKAKKDFYPLSNSCGRIS